MILMNSRMKRVICLFGLKLAAAFKLSVLRRRNVIWLHLYLSSPSGSTCFVSWADLIRYWQKKNSAVVWKTSLPIFIRFIANIMRLGSAISYMEEASS